MIQSNSSFLKLSAALLMSLILVGSPPLSKAEPVPQGGESPHFKDVAQHLEIGGAFFAYVDIDGDMEKLANGLTEIFRLQGMPPELKKLDLAEVLGTLGISQIRAIGLSSRDLTGGRFFNRAFIHIPDGRSGIMNVFGGESGPFLARKIAPGDTDLIYERDLNLAAGMKAVRQLFLDLGATEAVEEIDWVLRDGPPGATFTTGDLIDKGPTKVTVIGKIDRESRIRIPGGPDVAEFDLVIALEGMAWLLPEIQKMIPPRAQPEFVKKGDGGVSLVTPPPPPPFGAYRPLIYAADGNDTLYVASRKEYLDACLAADGAILKNPDFVKATSELPTEGNSFCYVSPEVGKEIKQIMAQAPGADSEKEMMNFFLGHLFPDLEYGMAHVSVNHEDGIFWGSNATASHLSTAYSAIATPAIAIMASFAVPVFNRVIVNSQQSKNINNAKQILLGCAIYAADNDGKYPDSLDQVVEEGYIEPEFMPRLQWLNPNTGVTEPWDYYGKGMTNADGFGRILLASPDVANGERIVGFGDGSSVRKVREFEFQDMLRKQRER